MSKLIQGINNLTITNPELAQQWHPVKNGELKPTDVTAGSNKKVWWLFPYDDPNTGKHFNFEWQATIASRVRNGLGCPYLSGKLILIGFNDLSTTHPKLAQQWHPIKNGELKPTDVTAGSHKKIWWSLPYDDSKTGKHFNFEWESTIVQRTRAKDSGCPYLSNRLTWSGYNDLVTLMPELAKEWHPTKNGNLTPNKIAPFSKKKFWWQINYIDSKTGEVSIYEWYTSVATRASGKGCPFITDSTSKLEKNTYQILKDLNVEFEIEKPIDGCKDKNPLLFDIILTYHNQLMAIELDGLQHFTAVERFGGEKRYIVQKRHDKIKDKFCCCNGIPLLRIPYIYDRRKKTDEMIVIIKNFIFSNIISKKIKEYYDGKERASYVSLIKEMSKENKILVA